MGLCKVSVTVHNQFGSAYGYMYVAVIQPEVKNISLSVKSCDESSSCEQYRSSWYPFPFFGAGGGHQGQGPPNLSLPPWMYNGASDEGPGSRMRTAAPPIPTMTTPIAELPEGTYFVNTKICFRVSMVFCEIS